MGDWQADDAETAIPAAKEVVIMPDDIDEVVQEETRSTETESEPEIYTGPNILAFALTKYQVFRGGLPQYVKRAIEKIPEIQTLIVPVSELEAMRQKISRPGTNEARLFYGVQQDAEKFNAEYKKANGRRRRR